MRLYQVDLESDTFTDKTYSENGPGYKNITWQSKIYPGIVRVRFLGLLSLKNPTKNVHVQVFRRIGVRFVGESVP